MSQTHDHDTIHRRGESGWHGGLVRPFFAIFDRVRPYGGKFPPLKMWPPVCSGPRNMPVTSNDRDPGHPRVTNSDTSDRRSPVYSVCRSSKKVPRQKIYYAERNAEQKFTMPMIFLDMTLFDCRTKKHPYSCCNDFKLSQIRHDRITLSRKM